MKNKISFLAVLAIALNINYVYASECVGEDCEITPIEITRTADVLSPVKYEINWTIQKQEFHEQPVCEYDYNCPFESAEECAIWYKKPAYTATLAPRAPHINPVRVDDMVYAIYSNKNISGNSAVMSPLIQRYNMLMNAADACCTSGIIYKMREKGADDEDIYNFLKKDANYYALTKRCLVMDDKEIISSYSNGVTGEMVAKVRNACLCKNKQWFDSLLQPFNDIYERVPEFKESKLYYEYTDGLQRNLRVPVNEEVQITIDYLSACPK